VVSRVRGIISQATGEKIKVGHSGTLDPLATGLLIIAVGKYTKKISSLIGLPKTYLGTAKLGYTSNTGDAEGEITKSTQPLSQEAEIRQALSNFEGELMQTPPAYSAIKVNGQRAYKLARKGTTPIIKPRPITVYGNQFISYKAPFLEFETRVSSGTYIRVLIEDIGKYLGCGAYMSDLRRTKIDQFDVAQAIAFEDLNYSKITDNLITLEK